MLSEASNRVDILLATYNGAAHLENQLLSLIGQTHKDWRLLLHDDGSTDGTLAIAAQYASIDPRIRVISDGSSGLGAARHFLHLLRYATAPYIIFCDQDDIWLENKLSRLLEEQLRYEQSGPVAVYCNGYAYSPGRGILTGRITTAFPGKLEDQLFLNGGIQGCSILFNQALKNMLDQPVAALAMHDHLLTLAAISFGRFVYVDQSLMLYRQGHAGKATADIPAGGDSSASVLQRTHPVIDARHYEGTKAFFDAYQARLSPPQQVLFRAYFAYGSPSASLWTRLSIILRHRFRIRSSTAALLLKTLLRPAIR